MAGYLTMKGFGHYGRFANQLFQYMFLRLYAEQHGLTLQLPAWVGNELFGLRTSPLVHGNLPTFTENCEGNKWHNQGLPPVGDELCNKDFRGYAQYHTSYYAPYKDKVRSWFQPVPLLAERLKPAATALRSLGKTVIGVHIRRGDYGRENFYITPMTWYQQWLADNWSRFEAPVLFVSTEDRSEVAPLFPYAPLLADQLGVSFQQRIMPHYKYLKHDLHAREPWQLDFYPDFYLLTQCDVLLIPNSTFSFAAALLAPRLSELWRSSLLTLDFQRLDPWDAFPLTHEKVQDYPQVPGIRCETNPYW